MPVESYQVVVATEIKTDALTAFTYMATADNWPGNHPYSGGVEGENTDKVAIVGDIFREYSYRANGVNFSMDWLVLESVPGKRLKIRSIQYGGLPVQLTITYTFQENDGRTLFTRTLESLLGSYNTLDDEAKVAYRSTAPQQQFLDNVTKKIEAL